MLSCTSERNPCCGPNSATTSTPGVGERDIDDVMEPFVDGGRIADETDTLPAQPI